MKKKPVLAQAPAAPPPPADADLQNLLGRAHRPFAQVVAWLQATYPGIAFEERFHAETGWHRIYLQKKRRIFYFTPKPGDFRFAMILGDKAVASLTQGKFAQKLQPLLKAAKHYPEGTGFVLDRKSFKPPLVQALLEAKLTIK